MRDHGKNDQVRIVHAPSSPAAKGTQLIRNAVEEVKKRGVDIDFVELIDRTNQEVAGEIALADLVVDQTYSDTPMATFATEAAAYGRPSIVAGYELDQIRMQAPSGRVPPSIICKPSALADTIEKAARDQSFRREIGEAAQRFVRERWNPAAVAERVLAAARGELSDSKLQRPLPNPYVHGWGLDQERARAAIRAVVAFGGPGALLVDDDDTRARLLEFAELVE